MAEEQKDEELKLREEADGSAVIGDEPPPKEDESDEDERVASSDEEHHDEEGHDEETDDERAARTERNRQRRKESKERRRSAMDSLKRELAARDRVIEELNSRVALVERKSSGSEMAQLERAEREAVDAYNQLKEIHASAVERADGKVATEAQERMFELRKRYEGIQNIKRAVTQRQAAPQPLDPRLASNAEAWMSENKWYDPSGKDEDSAIALTIDNRMAQEGWDPRTPEYWEELTERLKKRLPHRMNRGNIPAGRRNPPPVAGSGREGSGSSQTTYKLSADRVAAIKEIGAWDDPKKRAEMIRAYQQYDKENRDGTAR
jgi:hypothetical protein